MRSATRLKSCWASRRHDRVRAAPDDLPEVARDLPVQELDRGTHRDDVETRSSAFVAAGRVKQVAGGLQDADLLAAREVERAGGSGGQAEWLVWRGGPEDVLTQLLPETGSEIGPLCRPDMM